MRAGFAAITSALDADYLCEIGEDGDPHDWISFRCSKRRSGPDDLRMYLRLEEVDLPGRYDSSRIVSEADAPDKPKAVPDILPSKALRHSRRRAAAAGTERLA